MSREFINKILNLEYIVAKAYSCLEKLQDLIKFSKKLTAVKKATHSSNELDFEKNEPNN